MGDPKVGGLSPRLRELVMLLCWGIAVLIYLYRLRESCILAVLNSLDFRRTSLGEKCVNVETPVPLNPMSVPGLRAPCSGRP